MKYCSLQARMDLSAGHATGFDYLRIGLAVIIVVGHSILFSGESVVTDWLWFGPLRFVMTACIPMFFALSGFLTAGSYFRSNLHHFVLLRLIRLVPALAVEVTLSALIIGLCFSTLPVTEYLSSAGFYRYFLNIVGINYFTLPGVFSDNPFGPEVNSQLWTIPIDLVCYLSLIAMALVGFFKRPRLAIMTLVASSVAFTIYYHHRFEHPRGNLPHVAVLLTYVTSVGIFYFREKIPYSPWLAAVSAILSAVALNSESLGCLAPLPLSYFTIWLGLMRPPRIPFGDLSYGVYLFHLPIEQSLIHLLPNDRAWWMIAGLSFPLTVFLAWLSSVWVERPIAERRRRILAFYDATYSLIIRRLRVGLPAEGEHPSKAPLS